MTTANALNSFQTSDVVSALRHGTLEMQLGPFTARLKGEGAALIDFLQDSYRDVMFRLELSDVTDISLNVCAPSLLRKYFRPQVMPDPGFQVPALPLPRKMSGLAFEMGLNLIVALKCCRLVSFHAGVVGNDTGSIMLCANSGGGKSTLVAALMEEGFRLFSDEFALLDMKEATLVPYPRPVSLKNESIEIVRNLAGSDWVSPALEGTPKGSIAYRRARPMDVADTNRPKPAKLVIFPKFDIEARPYRRELSKAEALMRLIPSSTNFHLLGEDAFQALLKMLDGADTFEISYGTTDSSMQMMRDLIKGAGL